MKQIKQWKLILTMMFIGLVAVACSNKHDTPESVATAFVYALEKGNANKIMDIAYIPEGKTDRDKQAVSGKLEMMAVAAAGEIKEKGGLKSIAVKSIEYNQDKTRASVSLSITYKDAKAMPKTERVNTINTKEGWKVRL